MNFYKRFIGDITAKTGGLTLAQFGAYDRLLDHYYSTETPIPPEECYSICRAMTKADRIDVDKVLARFWEKTPGGFIQAKADEVIAKARPLIDAARANGKKGGRPKKTNNPEETQRVPANNPDETQSEPSSKAIQSQSQIPSLSSEGSGFAQSASPSPPPDFDGRNAEVLNGKAIVPIAMGFELPEQWGVDAEALGWQPSQVLRQAEKFRQYWTAGKGQGTRRSVKGWRQSWSNWLEKAAKDQR